MRDDRSLGTPACPSECSRPLIESTPAPSGAMSFGSSTASGLPPRAIDADSSGVIHEFALEGAGLLVSGGSKGTEVY